MGGGIKHWERRRPLKIQQEATRCLSNTDKNEMDECFVFGGEGSIDRTVRTLCLCVNMELKKEHGGILIIQKAFTLWGLSKHHVWHFPHVENKRGKTQFRVSQEVE